MRHERPFQHIHTMAARMSVFWIDHSGGITHEPDQDVRLRIGVKLFSEKRASDSFVESFFPGQVPGVDGDQLALIHGEVLPEIARWQKCEAEVTLVRMALKFDARVVERRNMATPSMARAASVLWRSNAMC